MWILIIMYAHFANTDANTVSMHEFTSKNRCEAAIVEINTQYPFIKESRGWKFFCVEK